MKYVCHLFAVVRVIFRQHNKKNFLHNAVQYSSPVAVRDILTVTPSDWIIRLISGEENDTSALHRVTLSKDAEANTRELLKYLKNRYNWKNES